MGKLLILILLACVTSVLGGVQKGTPYGNRQCAKWCAAHLPKAGAHCASLAAHGKGPCYDCGPLKPYTSSKRLCKGACTDTNTDNKNCGHCRTVCPAGSTCASGVCRPICGIPGCLGTPSFHFDEVENVSLQQCLAQCSTAIVTDGGPCLTVQYVPTNKHCTLLDVALPEIRDQTSPPPDFCLDAFFYDVHCRV